MSTNRIRVGVIYGGRSSEHKVSVNSAKALLESMADRYDTVPIGIDKDGRWHVGAEPARMLEAGGEVKALPGAPAADPSQKFLTERFTPTNGRGRVDVMFPLVHGTFGEDGTLQGLLEMAGIPYVGAGVLGSAVGMDKWTQKLMLQAAGIPIIEFVGFREADYTGREEQVHADILKKFGLPVFVKPSNSGSSMGIAKVKEAGELGAAIRDALRYDKRVVVERGLAVRELETAVLGNDRPECSRVGEVVPRREWYDYEAKYAAGGADLVLPAQIPAELEAQIQTTAIHAFGLMDCSGLARVDFFLDRASNQLYLNEINTIPGFTATSAYSKLWGCSGVSYATLVDKLIQYALERHRARQPEFLNRQG